MKILKTITSWILGFILSIWIIFLYTILVNPYSSIVIDIYLRLPPKIALYLDSNEGFVLIQILFLLTILFVLIKFYIFGYKDAKEKYDVTKSINNNQTLSK